MTTYNNDLLAGSQDNTISSGQHEQLTHLRSRIRSGQFKASTSGLMPGLVQGNLVILQEKLAEEFLRFCSLNPIPCPVIGYSKAGDPALPTLGKDIDIRIDVPEYHIFVDGEFLRSLTDIRAYWQPDSVAILLGCSFSFEEALQANHFPIRNIDLGVNVSMYNTNIPTEPTQHFRCNTVVSMRPFKEHQIPNVVRITSKFQKAHGAPIHIGDHKTIGIIDLNKPDYGDPVPLEEDDVPVFWGCGVTSQLALRSAQLPIVITHAPGKMLITGVTYPQLSTSINDNLARVKS